MSMNEMRKDYVLDRWVVIASQRKKRPTDFIKVKEERMVSTCPFCPGNEHLTPPALLAYIQEEKGIRKERDSPENRHKNWIVRCIPNLYPAFTPPSVQSKEVDDRGDYVSARAMGHHEIVIESPMHDEHPSVARIPQLIHVLNAYRDRLTALVSKDYVKYVSIFRNHGADAGASLSHAHTQMIATPVIPSIIEDELKGSRDFWNRYKKCIFCEVLEKERRSERFIWENESFTVFAPWAGIHPFEFWIFPRRHQSTLLDATESEIRDLALTLRVCLGGLRNLLEDPSYNLGFHMMPEEYYHWHIEVYPRLSVWAGFEKSTGMFINVMPPEEAASTLRDAFQREKI